MHRPGAVWLAALLVCTACSDVDRTRWSARLGSSDAQFALGVRYAAGDGVEKNLDEALTWLEKAAESGSTPAQMKLVALYGERGSPDDAARAERWLRAASDAGDAHAQMLLAEKIAAAGGDAAELDRLLERSAAGGDPRGQLLRARRIARVPGKDAEVLALLTSAAEKGESEAALELASAGAQGVRGVDPAAAAHWLEVAAEAGQPLAEHAMGERYAGGKGVEQDLNKAREWYERAANRGYAPSQEALGIMYHTGQGAELNPTEAARWYRLAADQGRGASMNQLGVLYAQGLLPDPETAERISFYTSGSGQHVPEAAEELAKIAEVARANNDRHAVEWYRRAIEANFAPAYANLARLVEQGRGADADPAEALRLYQKGAELNDPVALSEMAVRYSRGTGVDKNPESSFEMLKRAAEAGHGPSQLTLGTMYAAGVGVAPDPVQASRWLRTAMEGGQLAAEVPYATMLATGSGVPKDDNAARVIFERAAARNEAAAQWSMGLFAEEGRGGFTADSREAVRWWKLAAEQGQPFAQARLGMAYATGKGTRTNLIESYAWLAASEVDETKALVKELEKKLPAPLLVKAKRLAEERKALRDAKPPAKS